MKKTIVIIFVATLLTLVIQPAFAAPKITSLLVEVWPEYDKPTVLVMQRVKSTDIKKARLWFPRDITITNVLKDAVKDTRADNYDAKKEGEFLGVNFKPQIQDFFAEGYWDATAGQKDKKSFTFKYKVPEDTNQLFLRVQQPVESSNFTVTPKPQQEGKDTSDNLNYASYTFTNRKKGEVLEFNVAYTKSSATLSYTAKGNNPTSTSGQTSGSQPSNKTVVMVVLAIMLFIVAAYLFFQNQSKASAPSRTPSKRKQAKASPGKVNFCPECGSKADDKFCSNCGTPLG